MLFAGSIGRTDFPDGSFEQLRDAIHDKLFTLPDDTIVLPGPRTGDDDRPRETDEPVRGRAGGISAVISAYG